MSNFLYNISREQFLGGVRSWNNQNIMFQLLSAGYTPSATHVSMDDVAPGVRVLAPQAVTGRTIVDGYAVSSPVTFENATSGTPVAACLMYYQDASMIDANHRLIWFADQVGGLPLTLNGADQFFSGAGPGGAWFRV